MILWHNLDSLASFLISVCNLSAHGKKNLAKKTPFKKKDIYFVAIVSCSIFTFKYKCIHSLNIQNKFIKILKYIHIQHGCTQWYINADQVFNSRMHFMYNDKHMWGLILALETVSVEVSVLKPFNALHNMNQSVLRVSAADSRSVLSLAASSIIAYTSWRLQLEWERISLELNTLTISYYSFL